MTDRVNVWEAAFAGQPASVALTPNVKLPCAVDDPARVPFGDSEMPLGSAPLSSDQVNAPVPPDALSSAANGLPTFADGSDAVVTAIAVGATTMLSDADAVRDES